MIYIQLLLFLFLPYLFQKGEERYKWMSFFGTVVWCYLAGILMGNLIPEHLNKDITNRMVEVSVLVAVPLLLFTLDIKNWLRNTKTTIISFIISLISISIASFSISMLLSDSSGETWKIGGMLVGVYSGGTVNMSAIGKSLEISNETFLLVNAADIFISSFYMIFVLLIAKKLLAPYYPAFNFIGHEQHEDEEDSFAPTKALKAILLSICVVGISLLLSHLFFSKIFAPFILLCCTSLGIIFSMNKKIQENQSSFKSGEYLLYIFCIGLGSLCNFREVAVNAPSIILFVSLVLVSAIILHFIGAKFFKVDIDTALITNVAAVFGPAFVAPVARSLNNREVITSGLTCGLMGYAIGNYLGLGMAQLIRFALN